ncbi:MAG: hypothetical protein ACLGG9_01095 [Thermoleophilia bacterium]
MSVQRCTECGGLFANMPRGVCAGCLDQRERDFRVVRDWLRDNRGAGIPEVTEATGVDEGVIVHFIREGRIEIIDPTADPALRRQREDEERRAELVRRLADAERLGTSVRADIDAPPPGVPARNNRSHGMRARRG